MIASEVRIIQIGKLRTGSTLLTNVLYGLVTPKADVCYCADGCCMVNNLPGSVIIKMHDPAQIATLDKRCRLHGCEPYFVCSVRAEFNRDIPAEFKTWPNVTRVEYADLIQTETRSVADSVQAVVERIKPIFPADFVASFQLDAAVERVEAMNRRYAEIQDKPFDWIDTFFRLHGHHRNRDNP